MTSTDCPTEHTVTKAERLELIDYLELIDTLRSMHKNATKKADIEAIEMAHRGMVLSAHTLAHRHKLAGVNERTRVGTMSWVHWLNGKFDIQYLTRKLIASKRYNRRACDVPIKLIFSKGMGIIKWTDFPIYWNFNSSLTVEQKLWIYRYVEVEMNPTAATVTEMNIEAVLEWSSHAEEWRIKSMSDWGFSRDTQVLVINTLWSIIEHLQKDKKYHIKTTLRLCQDAITACGVVDSLQFEEYRG